jgi:hypothetical protein
MFTSAMQGERWIRNPRSLLGVHPRQKIPIAAGNDDDSSWAEHVSWYLKVISFLYAVVGKEDP